MIDESISQFMNRDVLQGEPDMRLADVVAQMNAHGHSAFLVCQDSVPLGVITERDAVSVLSESFSGKSYDEVLAAEVMTSPVHTLPEFSTMGEVMRIMNERRFRRVPIVDDKGQLSGIVNLTDLQAAMNTALERRGRDLEVAVMSRTAELQAANAKLEELSILDGLTGLLNRRAMSDKLEELHDLSRRYDNPYSVILLDIDHFKNYNDALGHIEGDAAIRGVSDLLKASMRTSDSLYRYGGEEFLIAMPETADGGVFVVAERIRADVEALAIPHPDSTAGDVLTISLGHTSVVRHNIVQFESWQDVVEDADRALYRAKQGGRNAVAGPHEGL